ncbi:MAG: molybdopterin-binding protein, partial [Neisseria sp.]|nr:molybdopterin-binding protein [Neisseria sp.]
MQFNLIIVGDEILHGTRADAHFAFFKQTLADCGFKLRSVTYLPDDEAILVQHFQRSFADSIATFVTGGIGATPDDFTRQAVAKALDLPLILHPEAAEIIKQLTLARGDSLDSAEHQQRLNLARFAEGVDLIPNPYNSVAGFS